MTMLIGLPAADPAVLRPGQADGVILGVPYGVPYPTTAPTAGCADAPPAMRARSPRLARFVDNHDFDLGGPMIPSGVPLRVVDGGVQQAGRQAGAVEVALGSGGRCGPGSTFSQARPIRKLASSTSSCWLSRPPSI
jgi:hypothetical protein